MATGRRRFLKGSKPPAVPSDAVRRPPGRTPAEKGDIGGQMVQQGLMLRSGTVPSPRRVMGAAVGTGNVQYLEPQLRNPLLSPSNFQLPQTSLELNQWIRYFDRFHPTVGNAMDMHAQVPFSRFALTGIQDPEIIKFYEGMSDSMNLLRHIFEISREYELMGECFPFLIWDTEMNAWGDSLVLNPDYVEVHGVMMGGKDGLRYELVIDHELRQFVLSNDPLDQEIIADLDPSIVMAAQGQMNAPLDTFNLSHLARRASPYDTRGSSILLGCMKDLLYDEQLREAMYAVAGGIVRPREIWKLGTQGEWMPSDADLDDFRSLLAAAKYDPNFALVSHYGVAVENVDAQRRLLPLKAEWDEIDRRLLTRLYTNKAATTGEGPCCDDQTEVLTEHGWKLMADVADDERLAVCDLQGKMQYEPFVERIVRDYDGDLYYFDGPRLDMALTPNHLQLFLDKSGEERVLPVEEMPKDGVNLRAVIESYEGDPDACDEMVREVEAIVGKPVQKEWLLKFLGFFVSEGWTAWRVPTRNYQISVSQKTDQPWFEEMDALMAECPWKVNVYDRTGNMRVWVTCNKPLTAWIRKLTGPNSREMRIPNCLRMATPADIRLFVDWIVLGDGNIRMHGKNRDLRYVTYTTSSQDLAADVHHLIMLLGKAPFSVPPKGKNNPCWRVQWSEDSDYGRYPSVKPQYVGVEHYQGKVYCFETTSGYILVKRNGVTCCTSNTYANASVAMTILDARYASKRDWVIQHLKEKVFLPVALANDFIDKDGDPIIPDFRWLSRVNLKDKQQQISYFMTLYQAGQLPFRALCDAMDLDYDEMLSWLKREKGTVADPAVSAAYRARVQNKLTQQLQGGGGGGEAGEDVAESVEEVFDEVEQDAEQGISDSRSEELGGSPASPTRPPKEASDPVGAALKVASNLRRSSPQDGYFAKRNSIGFRNGSRATQTVKMK
jgi:hypothetical protein